MSLATLLDFAQSLAESLAFFAATWGEDMIEDEPEKLAESLFAHIHGVVFSSDDPERVQRYSLCVSYRLGDDSFACWFSDRHTGDHRTANDIHSRGAHSSGQTTSDHDVIPSRWKLHDRCRRLDRVLFEKYIPEWHPVKIIACKV